MATGPNTETSPHTPDGRYFVVRGRLWRLANPSLAPETHDIWVRELMAARRAVRAARTQPQDLAAARARVDEAKRALGERGPVWWQDGAPDFNRRMAANTPYAAWYAWQTAQSQGTDRLGGNDTRAQHSPDDNAARTGKQHERKR